MKIQLVIMAMLFELATAFGQTIAFDSITTKYQSQGIIETSGKP